MRLCQGKGENFVYVLSPSLYLHFENSGIVKLFSVCMNYIFWCWHEKCNQLYWKNSYTNHHDGNKATELGFYVNHTMILCLVQHNRSLATTFWHIKILLLSCSAGYVSSDNVSFLLLFPDFYVEGWWMLALEIQLPFGNKESFHADNVILWSKLSSIT